MAAVVVRSVRLSRHQVVTAAGVSYNSKRNVTFNAGSDITQYKRGRGGRSSFSGMVTTVFGASGFLGRYMVNQLGKIGCQIIIPYRGEAYFVEPFRVAGDIGQVLFHPYHLEDEESIRKVMKYSNVVINLVGRDYETDNFSFEKVNIEGARRIARIARESGVQRLIHFSALNCSPDPEKIYMKNGSEFLKSKYYGEKAVQEEFPSATIFRPADMFGMEDRFIQYYSNRFRRFFSIIPLWRKGDCTVKQPVYVSDVAKGVVNSLYDRDSAGKIIQCVGPERYFLRDIVDYFYRCMRYERIYIHEIRPTFWARVKILSMMPSEKRVHLERLEREFITDVVTKNLTLEDLGVELTTLEERAEWELKPRRLMNYYLEKLGEFPVPYPPQPASAVMKPLPV